MVRPHPRPAVQFLPPLQRHRGGAVGRAEQSARDRGNGVGVAAAADRALQGVPQVLGPVLPGSRVVWRRRGAADGRPGRLEGLHDEAVVGEIRRTRGLRLGQVALPQRTAPGRQVRQPDPGVDLRGAHGVADGTAPQHAGIPGVRIVVGEIADRPGGLHQGALVVEVGQRHRGGAHQRAVPGAAHGPAVVPDRCRAGPLGRGHSVPGGAAQHRTGLDADVLGPQRPVIPALHEQILSRLIAEIQTAGGHLGDGDHHRGVVGPLADLPRAAGLHDHLLIGGQRRAEFVRCAQRIPGRSGQ